MRERWRLISDQGASAAGGLAFDEALMARYRRGEPDRPPALRLYTYASHCALVGRYQNVESEVDLPACARTFTGVNRRPTGGGAIVMGEDQLGVALVTRAPTAERPKETLQRLSEGIVAGLAELGIEASFRGKNDLETGGRKIAGLGIYIDDGGALLFHSSVLAGLDIRLMLQVLRIPAAKLGDKGIAAVEERVTTVTRELGQRFTGETLTPAVATGFEKALGIDLEPGEPTEEEISRASALVTERYGRDEWIFQRSPRPGRRGTSLFKTPHGLVRVFVALEGGAIQSVLFTGDFNEQPHGFPALESALKWARFDRERVTAIVERVLGSEGDPEVWRDEVARAVLEAGSRAGGRTIASPHRQGSCYFPEVG